jgi:1,4-alpha-glucan branching enzyme
MRPATAIAAAIGFMILGAAGSSQLQQRMNVGADADPGSTRAATTVQLTRAEPSAIGVRFAVVAPGVARVSLVGDFNGWDPKATPLSLARDGRTWTIMLPLSSGRHTYAFVIDDEIVADPAAPPAIDDDFGKPSSFVVVANSLP